MLNRINEACKQNDLNKALTLCRTHRLPYTGLFMTTTLLRDRNRARIDASLYDQFFTLVNKPSEHRVQLLCNWTTSAELTRLWSKMVPSTSKVRFVNNDPDYWVIINNPSGDTVEYDPSRTVYMLMEPWTETMDTTSFMHAITHATEYNNLEWHLSLSCDELLKHTPTKPKIMSAIVSAKYTDEGHRLRTDLLKCVEQHMDIDVYGTNGTFSSYRGPLPPHCKDDGLFPYKYTINAENNAVPNYLTEKLIDAVLSETLCFYWGCPNAEDILDPQCFIRVDMTDIDGAVRQIQQCINNNEWEKRLPMLRREKKRILTQLQFVPRLERILDGFS